MNQGRAVFSELLSLWTDLFNRTRTSEPSSCLSSNRYRKTVVPEQHSSFDGCIRNLNPKAGYHQDLMNARILCIFSSDGVFGNHTWRLTSM